MGFADGLTEGLEATLGAGAKKGENTNRGPSQKGLSSEVRKGVAKIFKGGKSGRSMNSSADTANEYSGVDSTIGGDF